MNWGKLLSNIAGVAIGAAGVCYAKQPSGAPVDWIALGGCVAIGVIGNLIGLFQTPPHVQP